MLGMIWISLVAGMLGSMNNWAWNIDDVRLHLNDVYMTLLMTGWMTVIYCLVYRHHVERVSVYLLLGAFMIVFAMFAIRTQLFISDRQFLEGMIPHHSMAVLMSQRIKKRSGNSRLINLANGIIGSQQREIALMNDLLKEGKYDL